MSAETVEEKPRFMGRHKAADYLGISSSAMLLLQRDGILPPDCLTCGRIVWKMRVLESGRERAREHLRTTYPHMVNTLIVSD